MRVANLVLISAVAIAFIMGWTLRPSVHAGLKKNNQLAQSVLKKLMPPKAKSKILLEQKLDGMPGFKVLVVLVDGPPGWVGGRHYHPGHVFGYVTEGTYEVNPEGMDPLTVQKGGVFYERPNTIMRARNGSKTELHQNIVFQILREDQPPSVSVK
jgi:quercetin dioxygenase-like cupin family protein